MNAKMKNVVCLMTVLMAGGMVARADVLALWDNDPLVGNDAGPISATTLGANVGSASLARGAGATAVTYGDTFAMRNRDETSLANAILNNRYLEVSLTAASGYQMDLDEILLRTEANNIANGASFALMSDVTGFTAGDEIFSIDLYDGGTGPGQYSTHTVNLGTAPFQGLTTVNFRVYAWGSTSEFDTFAIGRGFQTNGSDDLVLNGTVSVIPEPSTLALLGIALGSAVFFRRRKH